MAIKKTTRRKQSDFAPADIPDFMPVKSRKDSPDMKAAKATLRVAQTALKKVKAATKPADKSASKKVVKVPKVATKKPATKAAKAAPKKVAAKKAVKTTKAKKA